MKICYVLLTALFLIIPNLYSQSPSWHELPNSPSTTWRHDDLSFINENTGWVVYNTYFGSGNNGKVYKTTDGGLSWIMQKSVSNIYLRCIGFTDSLTGFIGTLGNLSGLNSSPIMYKTIDGGNSWDSITFANNRPSGLCGISVLNNNYVFACGRVGGPAFFAKTSNGGVNWISLDMSDYASVLIDCKFFSTDSGFAAGGVDTPYTATKDIVLFTSDAGNTWIPKYISTNTNEYCWKISFPDRNTGYISFNNFIPDVIDYLKTTNGGLNWMRLSCPRSGFSQGIGFLNENTGWIGGNFNYTYKTTNGGLNWQQDNFGSFINRIRFLNDSVGYAAGTRIYKFTSQPIGIQPISAEIPKQFSLYQNYPNPFNPITEIGFRIAHFGLVKLTVYDILGREVTILVNEQLRAGIYKVSWDASNYPSGVYFYRLVVSEANLSNSVNFSESKKIVLLK